MGLGTALLADPDLDSRNYREELGSVLGFKYQTFDLELGIEKILLDFMSEPIHSIVLYALVSKIFCYCRCVGVALSTGLLTRLQGIRIPNRS
jgi:hypothetical protein